MRSRNTAEKIALVLVVLLMGLGLASCGPGSAQQSGQQVNPQTGATKEAADPDPMFPGLEGIPPEEMFDHFRGGQFTMTDNDGVPFSVVITPGTVNAISATSVTITPNGQTTAESFNITPDTIVRAEPGRGTVQSIVQGDKIVVVTRDAGRDAVLLAKHGAKYHRHMMQSTMMMID